MPIERPSSRTEGLRHAQRPHEQVLVDLNRASARALARVEGVGHVRAARVVEYREKFGPFHSVDELAGLPQFDAELVDRLRLKLRV